jgi:hypothetical protein
MFKCFFNLSLYLTENTLVNFLGPRAYLKEKAPSILKTDNGERS